MKQLGVFLLAALPLCASVLEVGPISLTGSGTLSDPDCAPYGAECLGGLGLVIHASGTNGVDTVSINSWDVEITGTYDFYLTNLVFGEGFNQCGFVFGVNNLVDLCGVDIDGITGIGAFSLGGGSTGLLQVYSANVTTWGTLLAEAQIINTQIQVTGVTYGSGGFFCPTCPLQCPPCNPETGSFMAQFAVVNPPATVPEPGALALGLIGLVAIGYGARSILGSPVSAVWRQ